MDLTLYVNHFCNLRCTYCYTGRKFQRPMPLSVARQAVDLGLDLTEGGFLLLTFFGGEPMLEPELMQGALEYAAGRCEQREKRLFSALATNCTLLDRKRLELLRRWKFQVQVSLDGCPEAHNSTRRFRNGRPSHARVEANLKRLQAEGISPTVVAVIDPHNAGYLGRSFDYLMDLGLKHIHFSPNYAGPWDEPACERFEAALEDLGDRFMARLRSGQDIRLDPLNGKIVTHLNRGYQPKNLCKFGQQELAVAPSGRIYPCDRLVGQDDDPAICIGHVRSGLDTARRDALVSSRGQPDAECAGCELQPRCMFWCGCANYETTGHVGRVSEVVCWFERCFIAQADRVANTLFAEGDPTFLRRFYVPDLPPS